MKKITCIDLFAGGGGLSEGFHRAGYDIIAHVEKDLNASLTLKTRLSYQYLQKNKNIELYIKYLKKEISREEFYSYIPDEVLNRVINKEINDENINQIFKVINSCLGMKKVDIIIGGPPCQAYSLINRSNDKEGKNKDERKYLYKQYLKFIDKYKPKIFVFENVLGMLTSKDTDGTLIFNKIQNEMKKLGYKIDHKILNSSQFGVLQERKRIIIIGWRNNIKIKYPDFESLKSSYSISDLFRDLPRIKSGESIDFGKYRNNFNECLREIKVKSDNWTFLTQHIARPHNKNDLEIYKIAIQKFENGEKLKYNDLPKNLKTQKNTTSFLDRFKVVNGKNLSSTVVAHISKDGHYYIHPDKKQNRSITVREAARIQTFPDDYYFESSRTSAFMQIGNAVPPLMAEKIAYKIKDSLI